jgi:hypothetical protein
MTDPIDLVRSANPVPDPRADPRSALGRPAHRELLEEILATDPRAHARAARTTAGLPSWRHGARALVLVLVMALATGAATAAVLLSGATHSAPLAGTFPGSKSSLSSTSYRIGFTPDITGGVVGWCDQIELTTRLAHPRRHDHFQRVYSFRGGAAGCGSGPTVAEPFIDADVVGGSGGRHGWHFSYQMAYYLTAPQVAAVRASPTLTILTRPEPRLPNDYRVAVGFPEQEHGGAPRAMGAFSPVALGDGGRELARRRLPGGTTPPCPGCAAGRLACTRGGLGSWPFSTRRRAGTRPCGGGRRRPPARSTAPASPELSSSSATSSCRFGPSRR